MLDRSARLQAVEHGPHQDPTAIRRTEGMTVTMTKILASLLCSLGTWWHTPHQAPPVAPQAPRCTLTTYSGGDNPALGLTTGQEVYAC